MGKSNPAVAPAFATISCTVRGAKGVDQRVQNRNFDFGNTPLSQVSSHSSSAAR